MQWINGYRTHPKVIFVLSILHPHTIFKQVSTYVVCIDVGVVISTLRLFTSFKHYVTNPKAKKAVNPIYTVLLFILRMLS